MVKDNNKITVSVLPANERIDNGSMVKDNNKITVSVTRNISTTHGEM